MTLGGIQDILNDCGFDVLTFDRLGVGFSDVNIGGMFPTAADVVRECHFLMTHIQPPDAKWILLVREKSFKKHIALPQRTSRFHFADTNILGSIDGKYRFSMLHCRLSSKYRWFLELGWVRFNITSAIIINLRSPTTEINNLERCIKYFTQTRISIRKTKYCNRIS